MLEKAAKKVCGQSGAEYLRTKQDFLNKMNLRDADMIRVYGYDPNPGKGTDNDDVQPDHSNKIAILAVIILILLISLVK